MRIAGINNPSYHLNQPNKPQKKSSDGQSAASDPSYLPQGAASSVISDETRTLVSQQNVSQQKSVLQPSSARNDTRHTDSDYRVQFYSQKEALQEGEWHAYTSNSQSAASATPDNTSHKARAAISEYLQTQYIEERLQFKAVLGIDDYA